VWRVFSPDANAFVTGPCLLYLPRLVMVAISLVQGKREVTAPNTSEKVCTSPCAVL
jgi:hypothetical protein